MEQIRQFKIGDAIILRDSSPIVTDRNSKLRVGDTGELIRFHYSHLVGKELVTVMWDRPGLGNARQDRNGYWRHNCWTISLSAIALLDSPYEKFDLLSWKVREMYNRQPYIQKQRGTS